MIALCAIIIINEGKTSPDTRSHLLDADPKGIVFSDIEGLIRALGGEVREGEGSRVVFELKGSRKYLHRPHPGKEARKYQVEELREWFDKLEVRS